MRLTLVRHGQTFSNVAGALDTAAPGAALTELGLRQAAAVPEALAATRIDAMFASDRLRAQQTAAPLAAARGIAVDTIPNLSEIAAGDLEMATDADSVHRYIGALIAWLSGDLTARIPGGPNGSEFLDRYDAAVEEIVRSVGPGGTAVAVSHGAAIRAWAGARAANANDMVGGGPRAHLDNTGAVVLERDGTGPWRIAEWHTAALGGAALDAPAESGPTA